MTAKRRRFFAFVANQPPQRYFVTMQFIMLAAIMLFLLYGAFELFNRFSLTAGTFDMSPEQLRLHIKELYASLFMRLLFVFLVGFFVNVFVGLMFLHRLTGPLVQVRNVLNKLADGDFPEGPVRFRRGDFTPELAVALSRLVGYLRKNIKEKTLSAR